MNASISASQPGSGPARALRENGDEPGRARILLVEDDDKTAAYLTRGLGELGFEVESVGDGERGLAVARRGGCDLMVLDIGLPGKDGRAVLRDLRADGSELPVMFLSARDSVNDRVRGLELGADDYLVKPFAFAELVARIRLLLRRGPARAGLQLAVGDLQVDLSAMRAVRAGKRLELTQTEFGVLVVLMRHSPATVSRRQLSELVWDIHFDANTNVIDVAIKRLRSKVDEPFAVALIHTVRGVGYACLAPASEGA
jgi:two-component system copper resistance phosphate regulon response regulator CusR